MSHLRHLGLAPTHQHKWPAGPAKVIAPAPRSKTPPTALESAHVVKMLSAALNIEDSAKFLEKTPHYSGLLRDEIQAVHAAAKRVNQRMMAEGHEDLNTAVDTLNRRGNLSNQLNLLLNSVPEEIGLQAAAAFARVVERWRTPKPRPARRICLHT